MEHADPSLLMPLIHALEASWLGVTVRQSIWLYPVASVLHVIGVGLLLGTIIAFDLRVLGLARALPLHPLARLLIPLAALGVAMQLPTGFLMLTADANALLTHPLMLAKLSLVLLALANIAWFHRRAGPAFVDLYEPLPGSLRASAALSLGAWTSVAVLGRAIAYL
jgi:hypothetical protein